MLRSRRLNGWLSFTRQSSSATIHNRISLYETFSSLGYLLGNRLVIGKKLSPTWRDRDWIILILLVHLIDEPCVGPESPIF
jgi:hypothetical protein